MTYSLHAYRIYVSYACLLLFAHTSIWRCSSCEMDVKLKNRRENEWKFSVLDANHDPIRPYKLRLIGETYISHGSIKYSRLSCKWQEAQWKTFSMNAWDLKVRLCGRCAKHAHDSCNNCRLKSRAARIRVWTACMVTWIKYAGSLSNCQNMWPRHSSSRNVWILHLGILCQNIWLWYICQKMWHSNLVCQNTSSLHLVRRKMR